MTAQQPVGTRKPSERDSPRPAPALSLRLGSRVTGREGGRRWQLHEAWVTLGSKQVLLRAASSLPGSLRLWGIILCPSHCGFAKTPH